MGQAREVTNRIQKLRKSSGVSIDDQIEVFFEYPEKEDCMLRQVLDQHSDKIRNAIKMPFLHKSKMQANQAVIGETTYELEDVGSVSVTICKAAPHVVQDKVNADFPDQLDAIREHLNSLSDQDLYHKVTDAQGKLSANIGGKDIELVHRVHFFFNAKDMEHQ